MRDMDRTHTQRRNSFGRIRPDLCSRHNSPLDAYCCTDDEVICASCASSEHTGHTIGLVREERRRKQDEVRTLKKKCQALLQERQKAQVLEQIHEKSSETEDFCEAVLTKVVDLLQTHYMSLRKLVRDQRRSAVSAVENQRTEVKRRCSELDCLTHTDSDIHFLLEWPSVRQRCQEDLSDVTDALLLPFKTLQDAAEALGNQIQEFCNSGFASVTRNEAVLEPQKLVEESDKVQQKDSDEYVDSDEMTADNHVQPPDDDSFDVYEVACSGIRAADPQTREDFLLYACELTMDPKTAHVDLLLSDDLKEVTVAPQSILGSAMRYPERFLYRRQLLCKEGLQDETCYYEIEVTGGQAEIALAYKGICRKSRIKPSEFGGNANSWSLDRTSANYSVSHRGASVELTSVPEHSRIGVFLKFRAGTVSFYEVSDTMKFLYKIEDDFIEPLYPGFWIGENCRIRICDLRSQTQ